MKNPLVNQLKTVLRFLARRTLSKYRPGIIAVTGSVGKTSIKEAIYVVLRSFRRVRASHENFNNEIGVPLTVLGSWQNISGIFFWPKVITAALGQLIGAAPYPELLVLEYAADRPGDMDYLLSVARPQIAVVSAVGKVPVHVEFYQNPEAVVEEKSKLIAALPAAGFAVLNADDEAVRTMRGFTGAPAFTYGFGPEAQMRITNFENRSDGGKPAGIVFKLQYGEQAIPVRIDGAFGKAQAYAAAAAACVGLCFGINLPRIAEALTYYRAPSHRMKFIMGVKGTYLLDDSYNASPLSMQAALETVHDFPAKRRVGILGDMRELGGFSREAHETVGALAGKVFHLLMTVGEQGKLIADAARKRGLAAEKIFSFDSADEALSTILSLLKPGDLVLIKASRSLGLDRIVENIRYKTGGR